MASKAGQGIILFSGVQGHEADCHFSTHRFPFHV